jgi:hypothetical protein
VADPYSDQPLAQGFLPFWSIRGTCEIRGSTTNLWYAAAKALGFAVLTVRYLDSLFVGHLSGLCAGAKSLGPHPGRLPRLRRLPDIMFLDLAGLPLGPDSTKYWGAWTTMHLFYCLETNNSMASLSNDRGGSLLWAPPPPPGMDGSLSLPHP